MTTFSRLVDCPLGKLSITYIVFAFRPPRSHERKTRGRIYESRRYCILLAWLMLMVKESAVTVCCKTEDPTLSASYFCPP